MKKVLPFVLCDDPVTISYRTAKMHVSCHHCVACENQRQQMLSNLLQVEERKATYCNFITLTYDEENLPIINYDDIVTYEVGEIYQARPATFRVCWDVEKEFYEIVPPLKVTERLLHSLKMYNFRRRLYMSRHSVTNACYEDYKVAILYPRDLQMFLKRLRKYIKTHYNEEVRYYAIGEYGTKSLRPHWHLLLFYNSEELFRDFEDVEDRGTSSRPSPCAKFIYKLWKYGLCCTKNTDGKSYYYVSNYVNKPADFPYVLEILAPQKSYHSKYLGSVYVEEEIAEKVKSKDWSTLGDNYVTATDGTIYNLSSRWSLLSRLFPKFSGITYEDVALLFRQYTSYPLLKKEIGGSVLHIAKVLRNYKHPNAIISRIQSDFAKQNLMCDYSLEAFLNPLCSALYASKRFCENATAFGIAYDDYFNLLLDARKWIQQKQLSSLYETLQGDKEYSHLYYEALNVDASCNSSLLNNCRDSFLYNTWIKSQYYRFNSNIKHRDVADMFKFNY